MEERSMFDKDGKPRERLLLGADLTSEKYIHVEVQIVVDLTKYGDGLRWVPVYSFMIDRENLDSTQLFYTAYNYTAKGWFSDGERF